ncbi:hypothetical protein K1719_041386 [Acacia pycnantha]|nr:hypothetical protein K1719_041386 [Acacia pycnantha]
MDYQNALLNGPWVIFGHYLTVQPWSPSFKPHEHVVNQIMGWIRLPRLPARYYHKNIIRSIGSIFGDVIRVDYNTDSGDRGKFARLAVNIDLSKPLTSKIRVDGELIYVEYEGLPAICFDCGRYGHLKEACPGNSVEAAGAMPEAPHDPVENAGAPTTATLSKEKGDFGNTIPHAEFSFQRKKGKETKQPLRIEPSTGKHQSITQTPNQDSIFNSHYYASQEVATSLDTNHHSAILIVDSRLPHRHQDGLVGPSHHPISGNDPQSNPRGHKLASGVTIHHLGAKSNPNVAEPSIRYIKEFAREIQGAPVPTDSRVFIEGVTPNPNPSS